MLVTALTKIENVISSESAWKIVILVAKSIFRGKWDKTHQAIVAPALTVIDLGTSYHLNLYRRGSDDEVAYMREMCDVLPLLFDYAAGMRVFEQTTGWAQALPRIVSLVKAGRTARMLFTPYVGIAGAAYLAAHSTHI